MTFPTRSVSWLRMLALPLAGLFCLGGDTASDDVAGEDPRQRPHWAFQAPVRPAVPAVGNTGWARNPIDQFILARLESEGLRPSPEADPVTRLRRLHLDLTGLPPSPEAVAVIRADPSPGAFARVVDDLLRSPHYGERWGRHWLDAARYADSDGFEKDKPRFVWHYRDWVVDALNRDLPYDRFIIEQIAGDLLPDATPDQKVATGFLRNAMLNEEGGVDPEQFRTEGLIDRMDCIGKSILGLTIQCAQCHEHKFDPMSQAEYYRLFAFLNNDHESSTVAYTPAEQMQVETLRRGMAEIEAGLRERHPDWAERMARWEESVGDGQPEWHVVPHVNAGDNGERFYHYEDGSIRAASYAPTQWTAHFVGTNTLPVIGAFRLELLPDPNLPSGGPGRSIHGMAALSEFQVEAVDPATPTNRVKVKFVRATADFANAERRLEPEFRSEWRESKGGDTRRTGPVAFAIDGDDDTAWGIDAGPGRRNVARQAVFVPEAPLEFPPGTVLHIRYRQNHGGDNSDDNQNHNLGRWRLSATAATNAVADTVPAAVRRILAIPAAGRTPSQVATVFHHWRTTVPEFADANARIEALWQRWPAGAPTLTLAARTGSGPGEDPRVTRMFRRGDWLKPGVEVDAGTPAFLHPLPPDADGSRLTFARWLVDPKSPTTARALVNRVWQAYFGTGLVETPEDLGLQAPEPSHPDLLDWLACEFMDRGWSLKALHRLIVGSATYAQSSRVTAELAARDPYNRLLARGPRFRVEGEIVRDIALSVSGLLHPAIGGPPVHPPSPAFLYRPPASYGPKQWPESTGPDRYRRALYTFRFRSVPHPALQVFDTPNGDFACVRRLRSNTALQALTTLNEPLFVEAARALARATVTGAGPDDPARLIHAFQRVLARTPSGTELAELTGLLARQRRRIAEGWLDARELSTGGHELPEGLPPGVTPTDLAAYTAVCRVLLNLDETYTKE